MISHGVTKHQGFSYKVVKHELKMDDSKHAILEIRFNNVASTLWRSCVSLYGKVIETYFQKQLDIQSKL